MNEKIINIENNIIEEAEEAEETEETEEAEEDEIFETIDLTTGECYICLKPNAPISPCLCKNMYLHIDCQKKLVDSLNNEKCSVCKSEYNNIQVVVKRKYNINSCGKVIILLIFIFIICLITGIYLINDFITTGEKALAYGAGAFLMIAFISIDIIILEVYRSKLYDIIENNKEFKIIDFDVK